MTQDHDHYQEGHAPTKRLHLHVSVGGRDASVQLNSGLPSAAEFAVATPDYVRWMLDDT